MCGWFAQHKTLVLVLVVLVGINVLFLFAEPADIVEKIGTSNSYLVAFLLAALGGMSSVTGLAMYTTLVTFGAGGTNPLLLGLIAGIGMFISDSVFYLLASIGRRGLPDGLRARAERFAAWARTVPRAGVVAVVYLYLGFAPLPSDVLMVALVAAGYSYRWVVPILILGDITFATFAAMTGYLLL